MSQGKPETTEPRRMIVRMMYGDRREGVLATSIHVNIPADQYPCAPGAGAWIWRNGAWERPPTPVTSHEWYWGFITGFLCASMGGIISMAIYHVR